MKTSQQTPLGESIGFAAILLLMSMGIILLMSLQSGRF
jgi:hypothetical protein